MRRRLVVVTLGVLALVALAGCSAPLEADLGQENGYRYDADISVTMEDGLNESEQTAVVSRAMARIERIRGVEFEKTVPVEVISREEFRNGSFGGRPTDLANLSDRQLWNEQVWEALHIVGEDETYPSSSSSNRGATVVGYYSSREDQIVIVSDSPTPQISRDTLVHELVHALQDQQFNLGGNPQLQDEQIAENGVVEGEANYIEATYRNRCGTRWSCIPLPERSGSSSPPDSFNRALFLTSFAPYAEGPWFIDAIRDRGGWEAVDDLYENYPISTEQVIHPDAYPDERPENVTLPDRSTAEWERFTNISRPVYDTVGEASIYAMFQGNGVVNRTGSDQYDYDQRFSAGWDGDRLVPYRNGDRYGYVWRSEWESADEAREFVGAYRDLLDRQGADRLEDGRYRIASGPFADAFRVTRSGETVTIVNAPRLADLDSIHDAE